MKRLCNLWCTFKKRVASGFQIWAYVFPDIGCRSGEGSGECSTYLKGSSINMNEIDYAKVDRGACQRSVILLLFSIPRRKVNGTVPVLAFQHVCPFFIG